MFRRIWKWTKGDSILAEAVGVIANKLTFGIAGSNRSIANIEKALTDDVKNDWY